MAAPPTGGGGCAGASVNSPSPREGHTTHSRCPTAIVSLLTQATPHRETQMSRGYILYVERKIKLFVTLVLVDQTGSFQAVPANTAYDLQCVLVTEAAEVILVRDFACVGGRDGSARCSVDAGGRRRRVLGSDSFIPRRRGGAVEASLQVSLLLQQVGAATLKAFV